MVPAKRAQAFPRSIAIGYWEGMITREELHALVWAEPMTKVGERFGVSGSYMTRVCTLLNVPRPPMGYWAKLAVGKAPAMEPLPDARPGDQLVWRQDGSPMAPPPAREPVKKRAAPARVRRRISVPATDVHRLIKGTKSEFLRSRRIGAGAHLKPYKWLLPDILSSEACLDRALEFSTKLYNQLEALGGRVVIAPGDQHWPRPVPEEREIAKDKRDRYYSSSMWGPNRPTVVFFDHLAIGLTVIEMTEDVLMRYVGGKYIRETEYQANVPRYRKHYTWTTTQALPSGRLRVIAFAPFSSVSWTTSWQDKGSATLEASIPRIAKEVRNAVPVVEELLEDARQKAEIRRREWEAAEDKRKRAEDRRRIEESTAQSRDQLAQVIENWARRAAIDRFFGELSQSIDQLPESERTELLERLQMAQEFMGSSDPMDFFRGWKTPSEIYAPKYP